MAAVNSADPCLLAQVGPWQLQGRIAEGGVAFIYAATRSNGQTAVAKVLKPEAQNDKYWSKQFPAEFEALKRLNAAKAPGFPEVFVQGTVAGRQAYVMEKLEGSSVHQLGVERQLGSRPAVLMAMSRLVATVHQMGIIHNDLKPENFLMTHSDNRLWLLDFGNARLPGIRLSDFFGLGKKTSIRGTPAYMAPECLLGEDASMASDVYALGACAHFLFTAAPPRSKERSTEIILTKSKPEPLPPLKVPVLPPEVNAIINRCLNPDPNLRPRDAVEIVAVLTEFLPKTIQETAQQMVPLK
jgi:serine/threonine-protein kinase